MLFRSLSLVLTALFGCVAGVDEDATMPTLPQQASPPAPVTDDDHSFAQLFGDRDGEVERALGGLSGSRLRPVHCDAVLDIADIDGRCDAADGFIRPETGESRAARPIENDEEYATPIRLFGSRFVDAPERSFTFVRVRSDAAWFIDEMGNVLGTAPTGVCVLADGPLKNPGLGNAMGYAIRVRDRLGRRCRGYVSQTVADESERAPRQVRPIGKSG